MYISQKKQKNDGQCAAFFLVKPLTMIDTYSEKDRKMAKDALMKTVRTKKLTKEFQNIVDVWWDSGDAYDTLNISVRDHKSDASKCEIQTLTGIAAMYGIGVNVEQHRIMSQYAITVA